MKRLFSLILCLSILMISLGTVSLAAHEQSLIITETFEDSWIVDVKGENLPEISDTVDKKYYLHDTAFAYHYDAYSQLDTAQKIIYDAVVANPGKLSITINFADGVFDYNKNWNQEYFTEVMNALCTDRPDIFYYAGYSIGGGAFHSNVKYVKTLNYNCGVYDESIYTSSNLTAYYNTLMAKVPQVPVDTSNRYNFIKSLHDYLAENVYYPDLNTSDYVMSAHDAYGALIEGRAVCQGYSDAVKLICDYYSIPCVCISGTANGGGHMWNAIQMEDGKWYLMDLTWDDQDHKTYYDFFLVGTQSTNTYFGGQKFSTEHINDADLALPNLQYAATAYNRNQNMYTLFSGTLDSPYFNENNNFLYFSFLAMLNNGISTKIYYNGIYTGAEASHGVEFQIKDSNENVSDCTAVIVGDPSGDGQLTRDDYDVAIEYVLSGDSQADNSTAGKCDVNGDGYVDALDLALMHLVESDNIKNVTDF